VTANTTCDMQPAYCLANTAGPKQHLVVSPRAAPVHVMTGTGADDHGSSSVGDHHDELQCWLQTPCFGSAFHKWQLHSAVTMCCIH
jgi:hypothetical protein